MIKCPEWPSKFTCHVSFFYMGTFGLHVNYGPVHICSRYTTPAKCSWNKFSVHERSDCEHSEMFSVPLRSDLKSAHISVCAVWLIVYTVRNVWCHFNVHSPCWCCLRAKPRPLRTCSRFHSVQTSFWRHTKGAICSENMLWPCSSWNCSNGNTTL